MRPLTDADQISDIAFGFMGSKALFTAIEHRVFDRLAQGPATAEDVARATDLATERAQTLLTALAGLGLVSVKGEAYANSPAALAFLVKGAKYDFSDYLRLQVGRQMYGLLDQIDDALANRLAPDATASYAEWFADADEARLYSESQHAGSLGPARQLARALDLSEARRMLDVGGGTGAFAITFAEAAPDLQVTIVDFPNVAAIGRGYVEEAGMADRITYVEGNALETAWPRGQDVILMSYLFSGVPGDAHPGLLAHARDCLVPGGRLLLHDFVVRADRSGPKLAALWQLQHTAFTPRAHSLDAAGLVEEIGAAGFAEVEIAPMIPEMTMLAQAVRPA